MEVRILKIYLWMDGDHFDPNEFNANVGPYLKGAVGYRKRIENDVEVKGSAYWKSEVFEIEGETFDSKLEELLCHLNDMKKLIPASTRVVAQIVSEFETMEDIAGYYLPPGLITSLSNVGAALDIDVVEKLSA